MMEEETEEERVCVNSTKKNYGYLVIKDNIMLASLNLSILTGIKTISFKHDSPGWHSVC